MGSGLDESGGSVKRCGLDTSDALDVAIELLEDIQKMIGKGVPKWLKVRFGDKTVARLPLALTAAAAFAAGLTAVLVTKLSIEIEHDEA